MNSRQNIWKERRIEHRLNVKIVAYIATQNQVREDMQLGNMNNTNSTNTCDKKRTKSGDNANYA